MTDSVSSEQDGSLSVRRAVALALVGVLVLSAVGGIAAGQQGGSGAGNTTANATNASGGDESDTSSSGPAERAAANRPNTSGGASGSDSLAPDPFGSGNASVDSDAAQVGNASPNSTPNATSNATNASGGNGSETTPSNPAERAAENRPNASTIYDDPNTSQARSVERAANNSPNTSDVYNGSSRNASVDPDMAENRSGLEVNIPSIMDIQLGSLADSFKEAAADTLGTIYNLAFSTPVPENDGWRGIFGEPTNATNGTGSPQNATNATGAGQNATNATNASDSWGQVLGLSSDRAFQQLHQQFLMDRLYPLLNYVLGIGVIVLGLSLTVNPFMSRFSIINLMVKFVTFLFLYAFSWGAITLMHGVVNEITMWLRPSSAELESLLISFDTLGAASAAAYFAGAGGIFTTVLGMGLELAVRHLALVYFLPYVFPVLILILYLSPWQRLKQFASMGIWQYVNVLTMVIPMAAFLKAALIVDFSPTDGIGGMIVLLALFILAVIVPLIQTYFFIQIPGTAAWAAKSAGSAVASRAGAAKEKVWGSDDSSSDSTATGNTNPGDRAEAAVEASASSRSSMSSSGKLSSESVERMDPAGNSETTAAQVRALDEEQHRDPNNADAKYEAYVEKADSSGPNRTTMHQKLAD